MLFKCHFLAINLKSKYRNYLQKSPFFSKTYSPDLRSGKISISGVKTRLEICLTSQCAARPPNSKSSLISTLHRGPLFHHRFNIHSSTGITAETFAKCDLRRAKGNSKRQLAFLTTQKAPHQSC